ncbi:putative B-cell receptor-associated protein 29/31 [Lupinus albus]|uniref:Putative B-cell receptor-associated protein 29/31 n=1 Tax=Lupinus albus TaxID=3870 RepID=A0A6A4R885_LUPAL|nr:putative B-cell receptor-associated protein 29/31 [Lupinus albus]
MVSLKEKEEKSSKEIKQLSESLKKMKLESEEKDKIIEIAESRVASLQKQAADLLLEYDRLLEDNQNLQVQTLRH